MKFGNYAILSEVKHTFEKEPGWWWLINPPNGQAELEVSKILTTDRSRMELDGTRVTVMPSTLEVAIREIAVTFGGTNIPMSETDETPIMNIKMSTAQREDVLKQMPRAMILELWNAVGAAVPGWGPAKPKANNIEETDAKN